VGQRIDIRRISISVPDKAFTSWGLVDDRSAGPARTAGIAEFGRQIDVNAATLLAPSYAKESGMRYVPLSFD
jgi:hypothetical protein